MLKLATFLKVFSLVFLFSAGTAYADDTYSNTGSITTDLTVGYSSTNSGMAAGEATTTNAGTVSSLNVDMNCAGSCSSQAYVTIETNSGYKPSGSATCTSNNVNVTTLQVITFTFASCSLAANTAYWIVEHRVGGYSTTQYLSAEMTAYHAIPGQALRYDTSWYYDGGVGSLYYSFVVVTGGGGGGATATSGSLFQGNPYVGGVYATATPLTTANSYVNPIGTLWEITLLGYIEMVGEMFLVFIPILALAYMLRHMFTKAVRKR